MSINEATIFETEVKIAASPQTVFDFLINPEKMELWMGQSDKVDLDPQKGGIYRTDLNGSSIARGEFLEVESPSRLLISFGWEGEGVPVPAGSSKVEFNLSAEGEGTLLRLKHTDLPAAEVEIHGEGWGLYLSRLTDVVEGRDPGPDPNMEPGEMEG